MNRLAEAIRGTSHNVVREEVRPPQRAVVRTVDPLRVELTNARLVLEDEDLIMSQEVRTYDYNYGIAVGDTVVLLPVSGEEWVISNVVSQQDILGGGPSEAPGEDYYHQVPSGAINGTNTTFITPSHYEAGSLQVFLNGLLCEPTDYTETPATGTVVFDVAPPVGSSIRVHYYVFEEA